MKKCIICKAIFPKEVETVWKYTCHRLNCHKTQLRKQVKKRKETKQKLWKNQQTPSIT